jgi:octaprenyl-diphosphate synthase
MANINGIKSTIASAFEQFESEFNKALTSDIFTIQKAIETIHQSSGKHIRPLLLLLTAQACGKLDAASVHSAVVLELLHTASLIHDDVVDETKQRRGVPSISAIYDNRIAVLVGDFILADALIRAVETGSSQIVKIIAALSREMAEGEIKQLENIYELVLHEKDYFIALEKKTAMLLASCTEIGAITANANAELQQKCREFGQYLGYSFQIKDDIFDYFDCSETGKPSGNDIREGKVTLPLIYALERANNYERETCLRMLSKQEIYVDHITALIKFAKAHGGIAYAEQRMFEYKQKADKIIQTLPDLDARKSLLLLSDYIVERKK